LTKQALTGIIILISVYLLSGCATIVGGMRYNALVEVPKYPDAQVKCNISHLKDGQNRFRLKRSDADKVEFTISHEGCADQTTRFYSRKIRGWALTGTIVGWTGLSLEGGDPNSTEDDTWIPVPWGVFLDGMTGAWWKPDEFELGVTKQNMNNYIYSIDYKGCDAGQEVVVQKPKNSSATVIFYRRSKNESDLAVDVLINDETVYSFFPHAYKEVKLFDSTSLKICPQDEYQDCVTIATSDGEITYIKISQLSGSKAVIIEKVSESKGEFESVKARKKMGAY